MYKDPWKEQAYRRLKVIRERCNRPGHVYHQYYGGKGVKCLISVEDFFKFFSTKPEGAWTVGRIDHSKDYTIDNIEWQTQSEQTKERNKRHGSPKNLKQEKAVEVRFGRETKVFKSQQDAAKYLGVCKTEVFLVMQGKYKKPKAYSIRRING